MRFLIVFLAFFLVSCGNSITEEPSIKRDDSPQTPIKPLLLSLSLNSQSLNTVTQQGEKVEVFVKNELSFEAKVSVNGEIIRQGSFYFLKVEIPLSQNTFIEVKLADDHHCISGVYNAETQTLEEASFDFSLGKIPSNFKLYCYRETPLNGVGSIIPLPEGAIAEGGLSSPLTLFDAASAFSALNEEAINTDKFTLTSSVTVDEGKDEEVYRLYWTKENGMAIDHYVKWKGKQVKIALYNKEKNLKKIIQSLQKEGTLKFNSKKFFLNGHVELTINSPFGTYFFKNSDSNEFSHKMIMGGKLNFHSNSGTVSDLGNVNFEYK